MLSDSPENATRPLVSVIVPVYNGERYLAQAIESVLDQSYSPVEIIIVDDGSTDESAHVAQAYCSHVRCVHRANSNTANARNEGVQLAIGEYIAFLDQDDVWLPDKLSLQMAEFDALPQIEAVFGQVEQFRDSPSNPAGEVVFLPMQGYAPSVMLIKKTAFLRIGPFDANLQIGEWVDWYARALDQKLIALPLAHLVTRRRIHTQNKGVRQRAARVEYARVLKASLDRRRAAGELS